MMHRFGMDQQTAMMLDMLIPSNTVETCSVASITCSEAAANNCTVAVKAIH